MLWGKNFVFLPSDFLPERKQGGRAGIIHAAGLAIVKYDFPSVNNFV